MLFRRDLWTSQCPNGNPSEEVGAIQRLSTRNGIIPLGYGYQAVISIYAIGRVSLKQSTSFEANGKMYIMSFIELLMPQRFYGVQTGRFQGRKVTKDYANCSRKEERKDHNTVFHLDLLPSRPGSVLPFQDPTRRGASQEN